MKRSEINKYQKDAVYFMKEHHFHLPPWAYWTEDEWREKPEKSNLSFMLISLFLMRISNPSRYLSAANVNCNVSKGKFLYEQKTTPF